MYDGFFRKIEYLRFSITDRCNFFCKYCRTKESCEIENKDFPKDEIFRIIAVFKKLGIKKLRFTGGEPFLRDDIFDIIEFADNIGIKNINVTTNGYLDEEKIEKIAKSNLLSINISLDTLDRQKYKVLTGVDGLGKVISSIKSLSRFKKVKINTVLLRSVNFDEIEHLILFAKENNVVIRFIELMPVGVANRIFESEFVSIKEVLKRFKNFHEIESSENSVAKYYYLEDFDQVVGVINAVSGHFCGSCNKVRVSSRGVLYNCLFDKIGLNLKEYLNDEDILIEKIQEFVKKKNFTRLPSTDSMMFKIGG
ncbi:GTP 3',8-cyclase MoaA [Caldicellulosiruptor naganoensis]|uniref:Radical SAM protein n=1 Tax=Caldicellulosiruptor naganoensis TaxID=29324 RepID=A0ABY7BKX9_9FIRM|nr:radical SAM protein [Caldicellulosiruptor naganoensis]WAM32226.1 radical SAM protein [Caldicellulosiruptor naganoensis]